MAIGFNGSGDYAKYVGAPAIRMTVEGDKCTIAGWIKVRDITPGAYSYHMGIENADVLSSAYCLIGYTNANLAEFSNNVENPAHALSPAPSQDTWYYFYITGRKEAGLNSLFTYGYYTATGGSPADSYTTVGIASWDIVRIFLGADSYDEWLDSCAAYFRVWTGIELSDAQLRAERDSPTPVYTTGLYADYPLADNTDTGDDSGNGRDLTFGGTITSETSPALGGTTEETVTLVRSGGLTTEGTVAGAAIEEMVALDYTLSVTKTQNQTFNENVSLAAILTVSGADQCAVQDMVSLSRAAGQGSSDLANVIDAAILAKFKAIIVAASTNEYDAATLARWLGLTAEEGASFAEGVTLAKWLGLTAEGVTGGIYETVTLAKFEGITSSDLVEVFDIFTLIKNLGEVSSESVEIFDTSLLAKLNSLTGDGLPNATDETVTLAKFEGITSSDLVEVFDIFTLIKNLSIIEISQTNENDLITLIRFNGLTLIEETQGNFSENVILSKFIGLTVFQESQSQVNENVILSRLAAINIITGCDVSDSLILSHLIGLNASSLIQINGSIILSELFGLSVFQEGTSYVSESISLLKLIGIMVSEEAQGRVYETVTFSKLVGINNNTQGILQDVVNLSKLDELGINVSKYLSETIDLGYSTGLLLSYIPIISEGVILTRICTIDILTLLIGINSINLGRNMSVIAEPPSLYVYTRDDHAVSVLFRDKRAFVYWRDKRKKT